MMKIQTFSSRLEFTKKKDKIIWIEFKIRFKKANEWLNNNLSKKNVRKIIRIKNDRWINW